MNRQNKIDFGLEALMTSHDVGRHLEIDTM